MTEPSKTTETATTPAKKQDNGVSNLLWGLLLLAICAADVTTVAIGVAGFYAFDVTTPGVISVVFGFLTAALVFTYGIYNICIAAIKHCKFNGIL